jgi:hypothetical protein
MTEHMLKCRSEEVFSDELIQVLCVQLGHTDADVRKTVVFCLVEVVVSGESNAFELESKFGLN